MRTHNYFIRKYVDNLRTLTQEKIDEIWYDPEYSPISPCGIVPPIELIDRSLQLIDWLDSLNLNFIRSYIGPSGEICFIISSPTEKFELEILLYPDLGDTWVLYDRDIPSAIDSGEYDLSILLYFINTFE